MMRCRRASILLLIVLLVLPAVALAQTPAAWEIPLYAREENTIYFVTLRLRYKQFAPHRGQVSQEIIKMIWKKSNRSHNLASRVAPLKNLVWILIDRTNRPSRRKQPQRY